MRNGPYELIVPPPEYPGKRYRDRYAYEHQVVYWQHTGIVPKKDELIHHINGKKRDNNFRNLELQKVSDHSSHHNSMLGWEGLCDNCKTPIQVKWRNYRYKKKKGQRYFFCTLRCMRLLQIKLGGCLR